ncbi:hypothetical protein HU200_063211 [Digitaria exilis]|uniref:Antimicrobial peptide 1 n=1 Tax=Digitaria exilis TaxID=1010633 RepID=A0A835ADX0_9POAL|nr:hypothetical protein HU200_063211 [Digitaria exilis]
MAAKCRVTSAALAVAILAVAMAMCSTPTDATPPLTSWSGPGGCAGQTATVEYCGTCSDLQYYEGQDLAQDYSATFYTDFGCAGTAYHTIGGFRGTQYCGDFGFRSVYIDC